VEGRGIICREFFVTGVLMAYMKANGGH